MNNPWVGVLEAALDGLSGLRDGWAAQQVAATADRHHVKRLAVVAVVVFDGGGGAVNAGKLSGSLECATSDGFPNSCVCGHLCDTSRRQTTSDFASAAPRFVVSSDGLKVQLARGARKGADASGLFLHLGHLRNGQLRPNSLPIGQQLLSSHGVAAGHLNTNAYSGRKRGVAVAEISQVPH